MPFPLFDTFNYLFSVFASNVRFLVYENWGLTNLALWLVSTLPSFSFNPLDQAFLMNISRTTRASTRTDNLFWRCVNFKANPTFWLLGVVRAWILEHGCWISSNFHWKYNALINLIFGLSYKKVNSFIDPLPICMIIIYWNGAVNQLTFDELINHSCCLWDKKSSLIYHLFSKRRKSINQIIFSRDNI